MSTTIVLRLILELWPAICLKESGGCWWKWNRAEDAVGIVQIRRIVVDDLNRIHGRKVYRYIDRWWPSRSKKMFIEWLGYYAAHYERMTGKPVTLEVLARMWNGGPNGWKKKGTEKYWREVKAILWKIKQKQCSGGVAQRPERWFHKPRVAGSNPASATMKGGE